MNPRLLTSKQQIAPSAFNSKGLRTTVVGTGRERAGEDGRVCHLLLAMAAVTRNKAPYGA